jgi:hypothetical protein
MRLSATRATSANQSGGLGNQLFDLAGARPSLDLDFATNKTLQDNISTNTDLITFTRASSGTYVGSDGLIKTATTNEARFDHNPTTGESLGLLVEEQRTNLFQRSEEFDDAYWSKTNLQGTLTANQAVDPDGATTADLYQEDTATTGRYLARSQSFTSGTTYSFSCWAKQAPGATRYLGLILPAAAFGTSTAASFTLSGAGSFTISISGTNTSAQIQAFPNGWYRCTLISQATVTTSIAVQIRLSSSASSAANNYTGDGTSGIYLWGAQLEAGAFPTSYIPTTSATVTRSADVASITGANFSSWYRQDEGTLYGDVATAAVIQAGASRRIASVSDGTNNQRVTIGYAGAINTPAALVTDGGVAQALFTSPTGAYALPAKVALSYAVNSFAASVNGSSFTEDTSGTVPVVNQLRIGDIEAGGTGPQCINGTIRRLTYWPQRLPNSTLVEITR